jgi:hypothetical protein
MREGRPPPPEEDSGEDLMEEYIRIRDEMEGGASTCPKCGKPLGATKTMNTDGKYYHPECARGW